MRHHKAMSILTLVCLLFWAIAAPSAFDRNRAMAGLFDSPVIDNIVARVGVEHGYRIYYGPAFNLKHAQGAEPPHYVEPRNAKGYVYIHCTAYDAADTNLGEWRLAYGVGQGFTGIRVADVLIHGNYYGADISLIPGDVNSDYTVNFVDVAAVASHNGDALSADTCRYDVNLDGEINNIDKALVKGLGG